MFVGYQAAGTLGRMILDGAKEIRIHGKMYPVRAKITQIQGLSAHADRDELMKWISMLSANPKHVYITHGEKYAAEQFSQYLHEHTGFESSVPEYGETVQLM
jgi:metallo-beta-lactamase family protein